MTGCEFEGVFSSMNRRRTPLWLLPNLLSLDAPLIALAWMWMLARALRVEYIEDSVWWVLALAIWCVYVLDRLVDVWRHPESRGGSPRHGFHWRWRWWLLAGVVVAGGVCLYQSLYVLSRSAFSAGLVAVLMCGVYFVVAFFGGNGIPYGKNFLAGMVFAMGVGIPVNVASTNLLTTDLHDLIYSVKHNGSLDATWNFMMMCLRTLWLIFANCREVWVFGLLCMMNITAIDLWEKADEAGDGEVATVHEQTLTLGLIMLAGGSLVFAAMRANEFNKPYFYAVMVAAALLQVVNHYRDRFSMSGLRVMADVALLVPLVIFLVA